jgi:hypothetical protein
MTGSAQGIVDTWLRLEYQRQMHDLRDIYTLSESLLAQKSSYTYTKKGGVSHISMTPRLTPLEKVRGRVELPFQDLQSHTLPLCYLTGGV